MVLKGFRKSELFENLESRTDKTTRCVIRSLRGRGLWLGGKRNYSINQFANRSVEFSCWDHLLRSAVKSRSSVEINCWDYLLSSSVEISCWDHLLRSTVKMWFVAIINEIWYWNHLLISTVDIICWIHLLRSAVEIIRLDQLLRFDLLRLSVEICCWDHLLKSTVEIICWVHLFRKHQETHEHTIKN